MMGDDEATAAAVPPPGLVTSGAGAAEAAGEGSGVVGGDEEGAAEAAGVGLGGAVGDSARAGDNPETARTADAATAHSREAIFRKISPRDGDGLNASSRQ
ncbi:hypothetical protein [Specibacter sp. NPDC078692]|uniref:hypothetical protein n=1 Tax=Specibacter sp. NPDC078692 TaxID=3155818 RepID=UPI00341C7CE4